MKGEDVDNHGANSRPKHGPRSDGGHRAHDVTEAGCTDAGEDGEVLDGEDAAAFLAERQGMEGQAEVDGSAAPLGVDVTEEHQGGTWIQTSVDALQEFCGTKLNLQRRAWLAVSACVESPSSSALLLSP